MADLSIAVLVGRLTRDSELKYISSGQPVCSFSVATSSRKKKGDEWIDDASFWDIELWGKVGISLNQYLVKGKQVAVEGSMRQDRWEKDGQPRMKVVINAQTVQLLGGGEKHEPAKEEPRRQSPYTPDGKANNPAASAQPGFSDDDPLF